MGKPVLLVTTSLAAAIVAMGFFAGGSWTLQASGVLTSWTEIIVAGALVLGFAVLVGKHLGVLWRVDDSWHLSLALLLSAIFVVVNGLAPGSAGPNDGVVAWAFDYLYLPISSSLFALLAVYSAIVAFKWFRVRSLDTAMLILGAICALITRSPIAVRQWPALESAGNWLTAVPVTSGMRAIVIGVAIGTTLLAIRIVVGAERRLLR